MLVQSCVVKRLVVGILKRHHASFHKNAFAALNSKEPAVKSERAVKESATY